MRKNNKGFTLLEIGDSRSTKRSLTGFTYVELIVATAVLAIAVAGAYSAFLSSARFKGSFEHDVMATVGAQGWLEKTRAEHRFDDTYLNPTGGFVDIPDPIVGGDNDDLVFFWGGLQGEVDTSTHLNNANPPEYEITTQNYSGGTHTYDFKRIAIKVEWDERQI